ALGKFLRVSPNPSNAFLKPSPKRLAKTLPTLAFLGTLGHDHDPISSRRSFMRIGYARTSTVEAKTGQKIDSQLDLLRAEGCDRIFADEGRSGTIDERPELSNAISHARQGDEFLFRDFSRVSRTKYGPFRFIEDLDSRGVYWRSIRDGVDSNS